MISCLITCRRLSSSPLTAGRTYTSGTGRSTSSTALVRYRSGRYNANVTAEASTATNTNVTSILRRRKMSSARNTNDSSVDGIKGSKAIEQILFRVRFGRLGNGLRNEDDVARSNQEVVLL